jgi:hypothetical protein
VGGDSADIGTVGSDVQIVHIPKAPGVTERKAIALAKARLEMTGLTIADEPEATAELIREDDGSEAWQVSLPIQTSA